MHTFYISSSELKAHKSFSSDCVLSAICPCMYSILFVIEVRVIYSNPHACLILVMMSMIVTVILYYFLFVSEVNTNVLCMGAYFFP